jgi:hypothetical protein
MLIDKITPHLPKDNEEVKTHVKCLQAMLDAATITDLVPLIALLLGGHVPGDVKAYS